MTASYRPERNASDRYAKGLLKPFKGKGEILKFRDELKAALPALWQEGADLANQYNRETRRVGLVLTPHSSKQRLGRPVAWRDKTQQHMGVHLLESVLSDPRIAKSIKNRLVTIETERLIFNAKVATISRQIPRLDHMIAEIEKTESLVSAHSS
ncbi:DUF3158 family protein [Carnimonas bestiolae]|uniref:DUF3158 family protein n=1 Tax=Carnimonas bestiolae TaxID=3402172 RepID=UPI003EDC2B12